MHNTLHEYEMAGFLDVKTRPSQVWSMLEAGWARLVLLYIKVLRKFPTTHTVYTYLKRGGEMVIFT